MDGWIGWDGLQVTNAEQWRGTVEQDYGTWGMGAAYRSKYCTALPLYFPS